MKTPDEFGLNDLPPKPRPTGLDSNSDDNVANCIIVSMIGMAKRWVYDEGNFYWWREKYWQLISREMFQEYFIAPFDGCPVKDGRPFKVNETKVDKVTKAVARKMSLKYRQFFTNAKTGVNCQNGFIEFDDKTGDYTTVAHSSEHRHRYLLPGEFVPIENGLPLDSLLFKFFRTMFLDDPERGLKVRIIQEVMGAAITGYGVKLRQPKALVLWGPDANNGKSQLSELLRSLVPPGSCSTVSPHSFWDGNESIRLMGKLLNTTSELKSRGIASELFKTAISGEPMMGKILYRDKIEFRPMAQHVFATNELPKFAGGIDPGVKRRLMVVKCSRVIPRHEMVDAIAEVIVEREYSLLLSFAIEGAQRLIKQGGFTELPSSEEIIVDWIGETDPVKMWMEECVRADPKNELGYVPKDVLGAFRQWAREYFYEWRNYKDYRVESLRSQMVRDFPSVKRTADTKRFRGIRILGLEKQQRSPPPPTPPINELLNKPMRMWRN